MPWAKMCMLQYTGEEQQCAWGWLCRCGRLCLALHAAMDLKQPVTVTQHLLFRHILVYYDLRHTKHAILNMKTKKYYYINKGFSDFQVYSFTAASLVLSLQIILTKTPQFPSMSGQQHTRGHWGSR